MKIKNFETKNNIFLAPMAGITDYAFRQVCVDCGAGLVVTEMVSALGLKYKNQNTEHLLMTCENESPVSVQLFGSDASALKNACQNELIQKFSMIDLNMGCPVPKVVKNGEGSALMKDLDKAFEIIKACVDASSKPVSVKFRLGFKENNVMEFAKMCESAGANMITIHGRTREQYYSGKAEWGDIFKVAESVKIPVIANGDINTVDDYNYIMENSHASGVMIGRASLGCPWVFKTMQGIEVSLNDKINCIQNHFKYLKENFSERYIQSNFKKHLAWYLSGYTGVAELRQKIFMGEDINVSLNLVLDYMEKHDK